MQSKCFFTSLLISLYILCSCQGQVSQLDSKRPTNDIKVVGGPFENGDFMYIGMPKNIASVDTSPGWHQPGQQLLITGTMFKQDGKTPAPGVILYYYHTDVHGLYANMPELDRRVARHGYIRGWVKSDTNGRYAIYTVRPAPYPDRDFEAHIHPTIKEPGIDKEYYIDEFVFDDDPLLTGAKRKNLPNRGGSGILRLVQRGNLQIAEHDIILGLNIPNYPGSLKQARVSGKEIGEDQPSFAPHHVYGPDKGSKACPVCKYGRYQGILYFVGRNPDWNDIKKWLSFLDEQSLTRGKFLKAYFIYGNDKDFNQEKIRTQLERLGTELNLQRIALTMVPSFSDRESDVNLSAIDPDLKNTIILYRNRVIIDKFYELTATQENFRLISNRLEASRSPYENLP
jgi:protocatechuate 3,4-dioxygenase beta subunit